MTSRKVPTRDRIKEAALELFGEQSYGTTTLQDIADRLGLTKAALYYYYKSKDDLLDDVSGPFLQDFERIVAEAEARPRTPPASEALLLALAGHLLGKRQMVMVLCFDRSVENHVVKRRTHDLLGRVAELLAGPDPDQERTVRGHAAIGAVLLPVLLQPDEVSSSENSGVEAIKAAASDALGLSALASARKNPRRSVRAQPPS
jgi:AcrR family transcriptional regulator